MISTFRMQSWFGMFFILYSASQKKQNPETMECCEQVVGCMTIIIYIS